tara:strand:- start:1024 stop:1404 length:381 start_codon:yes stop_codon:yes gene_type:complete
MAKTKQLYFCGAAADDSGATEQIIMVPIDNVSHYEVAETTKLDVFFKAGVGQETNTGDADVHVDHAKVRMIVTAGSGNMKAVCLSIAKLIADPYGSAMAVVADDENSVYCNSLITSVESITVIDAS